MTNPAEETAPFAQTMVSKYHFSLKLGLFGQRLMLIWGKKFM